MTMMTWAKRLLIASPFAIVFVLTVLLEVGDRLHIRTERIAGYGFAFATPWAWLLDHDWFGSVHSRWLESVISYAIVLWIPAFLYAVCLWLLSRLLRLGNRRWRAL
jgi:hypothetical protein